MKQVTWNVPTDKEFLGEWKESLPVNCVLNKGTTGCGATSLAIEQKGNTILAVPFVGLIENKKMKYKDRILGIYGKGDKTADVLSYLLKYPTYKIIVTYDSLPKLVRILQSLGRDPYKEAFLAIDEWHVLCQQYSFRYDAIRGLLDEAVKFEKKTYISATPIERRFWLEELRDLDEIVLEWPNAKPPTVTSLNINHPLAYMAELCKERLTRDDDTHFHVFLNSVDDISAIISGANLTPDNTKVVCSKSETSRQKNEEKLPKGFSIGNAGDDPKLFNFYTSTCFEGQDIFDKNGMIYIVSDAFKTHTMVDIRTSFVQICGRIRDSKYKNQVTQIYSTYYNRKDITAEEYEKETMEKLEKVQNHIKWMNDCPEDLREAFFNQIPYMNEPYVQIKDGQVVMDKNIAYQDIVNFKSVNRDYRSNVNMVNTLIQANLNVASTSTIRMEDLDKPKKEKHSFKELFELYCQIRESKYMSMKEDERVTYIRIYKPLVIEAYDSLGPDKVREMKYHTGNIKRSLIAQTTAKEDNKIVSMLSLPMQEAIPVKRIKQEIQKAYDAIGKPATATATDIANWFDICSVQRWIEGKNTKCFILINKKPIRPFDN